MWQLRIATRIARAVAGRQLGSLRSRRCANHSVNSYCVEGVWSREFLKKGEKHRTERAKAAIDRSRNGSTGSAIMAQLLAAANRFTAIRIFAPELSGPSCERRASQTTIFNSTATVFRGVLVDSEGEIASGVGVAPFRSLGCRDDRARTSRNLPPAPLDTRQRTETETATGKLGWLEHTGPFEDAESLRLFRQNQADEPLQ